MRGAILLIALATWMAVPMSAEEAQEGLRPFGQVLGRAVLLERRSEWEAAWRVYSNLEEDYPLHPQVLEGLRRTAMALGRERELVARLRDRIQSHPEETGLTETLSRLLWDLGRVSEAERVLQALLENGVGEAPFRTVARLYQDWRRLDRAKALYLRGRRALGQPQAFALELAELALERGAWEEAGREFLTALGAQPSLRGYVVSQLEAAKGASSWPPLLDRIISSHEDVPPVYHHLLSDLYLSAGDPDRAWERLKSVLGERSLRDQVRELRLFMGRAAGAGGFAAARQAYLALLEREPELELDSGLELAAAARAAGAVEEARFLYLQLADVVQGERLRSRIYGALTELAVEEGPWLEAVAWSDSALALAHGPEQTARVRLFRGRLLLLLGELEQANREWDHMGEVTLPLGSLLRLEMELEVARTKVYLGELEEAAGHLREVGRFIQTDPANEALELLRLVRLASGLPGDQAQAWGEGLLAARQERWDHAAELWGAILDGASARLAPELRFRRVEWLRSAGRPEAALAEAEQLVETTPDHRLAPHALLLAGEMLEEELDRPQEAARRYRQVLTGYAENLASPEARRRLAYLSENGTT